MKNSNHSNFAKNIPRRLGEQNFTHPRTGNKQLFNDGLTGVLARNISILRKLNVLMQSANIRK